MSADKREDRVDASRLRRTRSLSCKFGILSSPGWPYLLRALFYLPVIIVLAVLAGILFMGYTGDVDE